MHADYSSIDNDSAEKVDFLQYCLRNGLRLDMRFSCEVIPDPSTPFSLSLEDYQKLYPLGDSGSFNMNKTWLKVLIKQKKIPLDHDFLNWFFNSRYGFEDVFGDTCSEVAIPACWKGVNSFAWVTKQCFKPLLTDTGVLLGKKSLKVSAPLAAYVHNIWKARTIKVNNEARYHRLREERNSKNMSQSLWSITLNNSKTHNGRLHIYHSTLMLKFPPLVGQLWFSGAFQVRKTGRNIIHNKFTLNLFYSLLGDFRSPRRL